MMKVHRNGAVNTRGPKRKGRNGPVEVMQVDPRVWKEALRIARGDVRRIRIVSARRVEII